MSVGPARPALTRVTKDIFQPPESSFLNQGFHPVLPKIKRFCLFPTKQLPLPPFELLLTSSSSGIALVGPVGDDGVILIASLEDMRDAAML